MKPTLLTGNGAAARGVRLAGIDYLPAFPITPQTEIIETLAQWIQAGEMDCRMVTMDSEHSRQRAQPLPPAHWSSPPLRARDCSMAWR